MIWRLMASIIVMSDTGSISLVTSHTDWPAERQCRDVILSHYQAPRPLVLNGHAVVAKIDASCLPVGVGGFGPPPY
jgi:hypothetical protein